MPNCERMNMSTTTDTLDRTVHSLPMEEIFCDNEFNCRGRIIPNDVIDLAKDIAKNGLDFPITVQPFANPENPKHKYRILAGHRRFTAFRVNSSEKIPCTIRTGLSDLQAAALNIRENVLRKNLNILQEANGIKKFMLAGWSESAVSTMLAQSRGWVQIRFTLLRLPPDIQAEAAAEMITQDQIRRLGALKQGSADQYALLRKMKEAKVRGEKIDLPSAKKRDHVKAIQRSQDRFEIFKMINLLFEIMGMGFYTRCMAWCAGEISDYEFHVDIQKECQSRGLHYDIPKEVQDALKKAS